MRDDGDRDDVLSFTWDEAPPERQCLVCGEPARFGYLQSDGSREWYCTQHRAVAEIIG
jgi:hypothetical protein